MKEHIAHLEKLPFWNVLTNEEKQFVTAASRIEYYHKTTTVNNSSEACLGLARIIEGEARTCILSEEGREITLYRLHEGDFSVLTASCVVTQIDFDSQLVVNGGSRVLIIAAYALKRLLESNVTVKCFVYELAAERFSLVVSTMQEIIFKSFDRRLASFLVKESRRLGNTKTLNLTQEQIAEFTGSAREVVTRNLKLLHERGLVNYSRGKVVLLDINALEDMM